MRIDDFDYDLPERLIAQKPADRREQARLMLLDLKSGSTSHLVFSDLSQILERLDLDLLVLNDTKVIPARLFGRKKTGGGIELLLVSRQDDKKTWTCMARSSRPLKKDARITFDDGSHATVLEDLFDGEVRVEFQSEDHPERLLTRHGFAPLPPYIKRKRGGSPKEREEDLERYQTVYAAQAGAIAAPTAGLHFTKQILGTLKASGIEVAFLTLHVGAGTFLPVRTEKLDDHVMHSEWFSIPEETADKINRTKDRAGKIVAVGTTACRALESAMDDSGRLIPKTGHTNLFIKPGFVFRCTDALLTNFHLPRSTLLILAAAFAGPDRILSSYREAVGLGYRFYSYGDTMLIIR